MRMVTVTNRIMRKQAGRNELIHNALVREIHQTILGRKRDFHFVVKVGNIIAAGWKCET